MKYIIYLPPTLVDLVHNDNIYQVSSDVSHKGCKIYKLGSVTEAHMCDHMDRLSSSGTCAAHWSKDVCIPQCQDSSLCLLWQNMSPYDFSLVRLSPRFLGRICLPMTDCLPVTSLAEYVSLWLLPSYAQSKVAFAEYVSLWLTVSLWLRPLVRLSPRLFCQNMSPCDWPSPCDFSL